MGEAKALFLSGRGQAGERHRTTTANNYEEEPRKLTAAARGIISTFILSSVKAKINLNNSEA